MEWSVTGIQIVLKLLELNEIIGAYCRERIMVPNCIIEVFQQREGKEKSIHLWRP